MVSPPLTTVTCQLEVGFPNRFDLAAAHEMPVLSYPHRHDKRSVYGKWENGKALCRICFETAVVELNTEVLSPCFVWFTQDNISFSGMGVSFPLAELLFLSYL